MASVDCVKAAKAVLKTFSEADLEKYVAHVLDKMRSYDNLHGTEAVKKAIEEVNDARMQGYFEGLQTKVNDAAKIDTRSKLIKDGKQDLLQTMVRRIKGLGDNVEAAQRGAFNRLMNKFFNILDDDEVAFIRDEKNDVEIMRAVDGKPSSDVAKSVADKFKTYIDARNVDMINSNALPIYAINKDRMLRAMHDVSRMIRGGRSLVQSAMGEKFSIAQSRNIWKEKILPLLDLKQTFFETDAFDSAGKIDMAKVDKIMNDIFDNITEGKPDLISSGKANQNMFFYWKDMESWMTYNKQYGKGNFFNAMLADIQVSSNKIGLSEMLGSSPQAAYNDLAKIEHEFNPVSKSRQNQAMLAFKWVAGIDKGSVNPTIANFWSSLRSLTSAAKLIGRVTLLSLPDISNGIMFANRWGYNYFKAYGTYLSGMFNLIPSEERKFIAEAFKDMTNTHLGYMQRFVESNNTVGFINNLNTTLFRWTLMEALDKGNKLSAIQLQSRILGENSKFAHHELNEQMRSMLDKFNISPVEWNGIRQHAQNFQGKKLFTLDALDKLSNEDLRKMYGVNNPEQPLYQLKNDLHRKVFSMFDVASENSVLTPGAFMRAMTTRGTKSGDHLGEILRTVMQFKMYPLEFVDRVLYQGLKSADGVQAKLMFGAMLFGSTLPMAYLSTVLDYFSKGKSMPDWDQMNFGERVEFSKNLLLPGLGIMGSFYSPDRPWENAGSFFATPAMQLFYDSVKLPYRISEGASEKDMAKIFKAFEKVGRNIAPGSNMPFISPYMRLMFGDKPYLQPGQTQYYGA